MVKFSKRNGALFDRRFLNRIFGRQTRTDQECFDLDTFVKTVMSGSGFETKAWGDFVHFQQTFAFAPASYFRAWWEDALADQDHWVVVENREGAPHFAWFHFTERVSEWERMSR